MPVRYLLLSDFLTNGDITLASVIFPLIAGVILAVCAMFFVKKTTGRFVKALLDEKADAPETAKTLAELGYQKKPLLKYALRPGSTLRKIVLTAPADGQSEETPDAASAAETPISENTRFYIPEDKAYRAETTYNPDGMSILLLLLIVLALIVLSFVLLSLIPALMRWLSGVLSL